jgi:hypothetical protein
VVDVVALGAGVGTEAGRLSVGRLGGGTVGTSATLGASGATGETVSVGTAGAGFIRGGEEAARADPSLLAGGRGPGSLEARASSPIGPAVSSSPARSTKRGDLESRERRAGTAARARR